MNAAGFAAHGEVAFTTDRSFGCFLKSCDAGSSIEEMTTSQESRRTSASTRSLNARLPAARRLRQLTTLFSTPAGSTRHRPRCDQAAAGVAGAEMPCVESLAERAAAEPPGSFRRRRARDDDQYRGSGSNRLSRLRLARRRHRRGDEDRKRRRIVGTLDLHGARAVRAPWLTRAPIDLLIDVRSELLKASCCSSRVGRGLREGTRGRLSASPRTARTFQHPIGAGGASRAQKIYSVRNQSMSRAGASRAAERIGGAASSGDGEQDDAATKRPER